MIIFISWTRLSLMRKKVNLFQIFCTLLQKIPSLIRQPAFSSSWPSRMGIFGTEVHYWEVIEYLDLMPFPSTNRVRGDGRSWRRFEDGSQTYGLRDDDDPAMGSKLDMSPTITRFLIFFFLVLLPAGAPGHWGKKWGIEGFLRFQSDQLGMTWFKT